jgi:Fe-S-cluster containining protein
MRFDAECNCCGECCRPVVLSDYGKTAWFGAPSTGKRKEDVEHAENCRWIRSHWHRISRAKAVELRPVLADVTSRVFFYLCDAHDPATGRCTAYDERPPVCRKFPHYFASRRREGWTWPALPRCSFNGAKVITNREVVGCARHLDV